MRRDEASRRRTSPAPVLAGLLLALTGCRPQSDAGWQGYVEAEFLRVAAPLPGILQQLHVERGGRVTNGQPLFVLERAAEVASWRESQQRLRQARSRLDNLTKGRRPPEIAAIEARLAQARAGLELAEREWSRVQRLTQEGAVARADLDRATAGKDQSVQRVEELVAELATARLGGRDDELRAAEAEVAAAEAAEVRAAWSVEQKVKGSPTEALVHDTLFNPGEWVGAGAPVVSLLPADRLKVRFFVPEAEVSNLRVGQVLRIRVDGTVGLWQARLAYIAPEAEYTPPVIYSQENRAKLVFMCEARLDTPDPTQMHPGQPVAVFRTP